jgi:two-component sensor histidine kinase
LLGEIHHRVKNNLQVVYSLLDLQSDLVADAKIVNILRESQNRIKSMALIHQTLYESKDFVQVDFANFLDTLAPTLISSYGVDTDRIELDIRAVEVLLPISAAIPCGLVVNELISNALKHACPAGRSGAIRIDLAEGADGRAMLSVSDDGVGISDSLNLEQTSTLGLQLVMLLTDQLGGEVEIRRRDPTTFVLRFPIT